MKPRVVVAIIVIIGLVALATASLVVRDPLLMLGGLVVAGLVAVGAYLLRRR